VQLLLEEALEDDFQTVCEDGSPAELGELICTMWRNCGVGDFTLVNNALASEKARQEMVTRSQGLDSTTGDIIDSDDEHESDMDVEMINGCMNGGKGGGMINYEPVVPVVDADGFTTAARKGKRGKKGR